MAVRTTATAVKAIIEVDTNTFSADADLDPFIEAANALVTVHCVAGGADSTELELIERWLSAHFYTVRDPRTTAEKAGTVGENYQSAVKIGFSTSHYGQMALRLDSSGALANHDINVAKGNSGKVGVTWVGTDSDLTDTSE